MPSPIAAARSRSSTSSMWSLKFGLHASPRGSVFWPANGSTVVKELTNVSNEPIVTFVTCSYNEVVVSPVYDTIPPGASSQIVLYCPPFAFNHFDSNAGTVSIAYQLAPSNNMSPPELVAWFSSNKMYSEEGKFALLKCETLTEKDISDEEVTGEVLSDEETQLSIRPVNRRTQISRRQQQGASGRPREETPAVPEEEVEKKEPGKCVIIERGAFAAGCFSRGCFSKGSSFM